MLKEEVAVAALLIGRLKEAFIVIDSIQQQFPGSTRAARLLGLYYEATKDLNKAEEVYKEELTKDPTNASILRRQIAVKTGQGDLTGAVQGLKAYLDTHSTDWSAWEEAASLYLRLGAYPQAIFCLEEVLLHQPGNVNTQMLIADTLYASGGTANWKAARGYYSGLIEITGGENARALYGAAACTAQLGGGKRSGSSKSDSELGVLAGETLVQQYGAKNPRKVPLVEAMLRAQDLWSENSCKEYLKTGHFRNRF